LDFAKAFCWLGRRLKHEAIDWKKIKSLSLFETLTIDGSGDSVLGDLSIEGSRAGRSILSSPDVDGCSDSGVSSVLWYGMDINGTSFFIPLTCNQNGQRAGLK